MVAPLVAGLSRAIVSQGVRQVASQGAKKIAKDKIQSIAKDSVKEKLGVKNKKLSKNSEVTSSGDSEVNTLQQQSFEGTNSYTKTKLTPSNSIIPSASTSLSPVAQLKINVTNIHKFLLDYNKKNASLQKKNKRIFSEQVSRDKLFLREKKLESSPFGKSLKNIKDSIPSPNNQGNILDKLLEFIGTIILGVIVNGLPAIIEKVQEIIDNIVNFLTPIQSGYNLIRGFFTGELDRTEYNADRKRVDRALESFEANGGLVDQMAEKLGPLGGIVKQLKPLVRNLRQNVRGKNIVLAKKDGKEGFLDKETGKFTERQWTSEEREVYESPEGESGGPGDYDETDEYTGEVKPGHYYFPLPKGQFSGESGQWFGAGRSYGGHAGVDLTESPPFGSNPAITVVALAGGKVLSERYVPGKKYLSGMMIRGEDGHDQRYLHMTPMVSPGDEVKAGQKIGELVNMKYVTGNVNETHLHFEVYKKGQGRSLSPHKVYPQFFKSPKSSPKSINIREKASGGRKLINKSLNKDKNFLTQSDPSIGKTDYYFIQPYDTVQTKIIPYIIPVPQSLEESKEIELSALWSQ